MSTKVLMSTGAILIDSKTSEFRNMRNAGLSQQAQSGAAEEGGTHLEEETPQKTEQSQVQITSLPPSPRVPYQFPDTVCPHTGAVPVHPVAQACAVISGSPLQSS